MRKENGWRGKLALGSAFQGAWLLEAVSRWQEEGGAASGSTFDSNHTSSVVPAAARQTFPLRFLLGPTQQPTFSTLTPPHPAILSSPGMFVPSCCCRTWGCHAILFGFSSISSLRQTVPYIRSPLFERTRVDSFVLADRQCKNQNLSRPWRWYVCCVVEEGIEVTVRFLA